MRTYSTEGLDFNGIAFSS